MKKIPSHLYLDREELLHERLFELPSYNPRAAEYASIDRLWHGEERTPCEKMEVLIEFEDGMSDYEKHAVCRYDANAEMFVNEHSCYKWKHVKRWCYICNFKLEG